MTDPAAVVSGAPASLNLSANEFALVSEAYFPSVDLAAFTNGGGVYAIAIF